MRLEDLIEEGESFSENVNQTTLGGYIRNSKAYAEWKAKSLMYLQSTFPKHPQTERFHLWVKKNRNSKTEYEQLIAILKAFNKIAPNITNIDYIKTLTQIFEKIHICARQLKRRHLSRPTLEIIDEYDVQNLLNAILHLHFEDVRPEEWAPSYAGGNNRMDFLLKNEEISIEVKMTRDSLKDKELGEQLIIDIAKYKAHPNCKTLYCYVFDPDGHIRNPRGLENDLTKEHDGLDVKVYIRPL